MKTILFVCFAVLVVMAAAEEDNYRGPSEEDVIVLDNTNL